MASPALTRATMFRMTERLDRLIVEAARAVTCALDIKLALARDDLMDTGCLPEGREGGA